MRNTKLHHSLALCLTLSLSGLTACELNLPTNEDEGTTLKDKVVDSLIDANQSTGAVELRMVSLSELSARARPVLDTSDMQAEITVTAIAVRRCLNDAEVDVEQDDPADSAEQDDLGDQEEQEQQDLEPEVLEDTEQTKDEQEAPESGILGWRGKKAPKKDRTDEKDRLELPEELDQELPEVDAEDKVPEKQDFDQVLAAQDDGDTVSKDEELAEEGDAPDACAKSEWLVLKQDALKIDLLNLDNMDAGGLLAEGELPVGTYRGIRLMISDAVVRVGDKEASLKIPSGKASGLKIRAGFEVQQDGQVEIDLGFDLSNSLRPHRKHGWMLRPVLRAKKRRE